MNYHFAPHLLLRMPVKTPVDYIGEQQSFLDDEFFRTAIKVATPAFYAVLDHHQFQGIRLSEKETITVQKYINRYCFRPTPFGLFSSVSLVNWVDKADSDHSPANFSADIRTAMPLQNMLGNYLLEYELKDQARFESNPSIYRVLNEYRFLRVGLEEGGKRREYQLQSIAFSKLLKDLLNQCARGCSRQEIVSRIARSADCLLHDAEDYADFLIEAQLLINQDRMSINGADYLTRLAGKLNESPVKHDLLSILDRQSNEKNILNPSLIEQLEHDLNALLPEKEMPQDKLSVILKREGATEQVEMSCRSQLQNGFSALELLSPTRQSTRMSQFITSFQQHFEGQTLPLLQALDPEAGVGYQYPETEKNNPLLETLHISYGNQPKPHGTWSPVHSMLMESWLRDKSADPVIRLQDTDLERLTVTDKPEPILGMSVLFRIAENKVFIENAGGINAPALMGRFTVVNERTASAAKLMARQLEAQNPDLIFAELLHLADPHIDNVNRRAHIYHYEIPITAASTLPAEQQLQLSDLYVRIINNKVMLFSEQHQKLVIPRLTSAYNHSLNQLPLFRFLADLPYQYGRSNLGLDMRQFFPGLSFYPRVEYKDTILSLATWIIKVQHIAELQGDLKDIRKAFTALSTPIRLPRYFSLAEGDQELVFDGQSERDIVFFCNCIRQKKEVVLKEFLKQPEVKQYNAYLLPAEPIVLPKPINLRTFKPKQQRKYIPGSSWLYLKVYAPKIGANRLLLRLAPLLNRRYGGHKIGQWFFIRYEDQAPHIRLRLKVNPDSISEILQAFKTKLEGPIQQHVIREFQIDVYNRELERYAAGGIENTEHFFWASSELVLHFLKQARTKTVTGTHIFALYSVVVMIRAFIADPEEQLDFTLISFQQFLTEFTDKPIKVDLDKKYRELTPGIISAFQAADPGILSGSLKAGISFSQSLQVISKYSGKIPDLDYLRSIIHMHLNRIFTDESRKQEMICYYLLHKYLRSVKGRHKRSVMDRLTVCFDQALMWAKRKNKIK
ncbi:lantibiotic dehydratase [Mucilaginibacter sp. RCC_168]|uniref:lantibiotic dehydratase n=1 Tax=unclassified Mucilaginibacter TaxID=2617802 RepID=UPI00088DAA5B|nr:lantibiotic dehydratase [Mucilaginibacter sp. OK268]SDP14444.1 thiopeptide-type bacteriocin biosynthesis domain-containing protein [Mucilaginibacter sp. OK268]